MQEKQLIESRIRGDEQKERERKVSELRPSSSNRNFRFQPADQYDKDFYTKNYDYKPYNYLLNDRTEPSKVFGHDINRSPINQRRFISSTPQYSNGSNNRNVTTNLNPRRTVQVAASPLRERKTYINAAPPVATPKLSTTSYDNSNFEEWSNVRTIEPRPLPGLTSDFPTKHPYIIHDDPAANYRSEIPRTTRPNGFNYGLRQVIMFCCCFVVLLKQTIQTMLSSVHIYKF